jgi:hypothetical protein
MTSPTRGVWSRSRDRPLREPTLTWTVSNKTSTESPTDGHPFAVKWSKGDFSSPTSLYFTNPKKFRLRSCEAAYELLQKYSSQYTQEVTWIDESYSQLKNLAPLEGLAREQIEPTTVSSDGLRGVSRVDKSINRRVQSDAFAEADFFKCANLLQALYKKVNEHMPQLEKVNVVGSRYIREAKVRPRELTLSAR